MGILEQALLRTWSKEDILELNYQPTRRIPEYHELDSVAFSVYRMQCVPVAKPDLELGNASILSVKRSKRFNSPSFENQEIITVLLKLKSLSTVTFTSKSQHSVKSSSCIHSTSLATPLTRLWTVAVLIVDEVFDRLHCSHTLQAEIHRPAARITVTN